MDITKSHGINKPTLQPSVTVKSHRRGQAWEGRVKSQRRLTAEADRLAEADIKTVKQIKLPC